MKFRILNTTLLLLFGAVLFSQGYYQSLDRKYRKYFVGFTGGVGHARWISNLGSTELYDKDGTVFKSGDMRFKARNSSTLLNMEVSAPVKMVRMGLGICFEDFFLDKLALYSNSYSADRSVVMFDEKFRFQKFYAQVEVPFNFETDKDYSFGFKGHVGYFGYSGVKRFNFFGERALATTYFVTLGLVGDYKMLPHVYFYVNPNFEYKYFNNSRYEKPSEIHHNIFTMNLVAGVRFDVSREK